MEVADLLEQVSYQLVRTGLTSEELVALVFEADGRDIDVRTQRNSNRATYPPLFKLLGDVGSRCANDNVTVKQLRRITFSDRSIMLEFVGQHDRLQSHSYPIEGVA